MEYVSLGKIVDSFGLDGTIKIYSTTNMGTKRYKKGSSVFLLNPLDNSRTEYKVLSYRHSEPFDFVKLEGLNTPEEVKALKGIEIQVVKDNKDLEEGSYFYSDLIGCLVYSETKEELGKVKAVEEFPAQLTLRVLRKNKPDFFVPFIKEFIVKIDIENKAIFIKVIEGLLWKSPF